MHISPGIRSITFKLTLAFLFIGLTGSVLVAIITWQRTQTAFDKFIIVRDQQVLASNLLLYYQEYGSWNGLAITPNFNGFNPLRSGEPGRDFDRDWSRFLLTDADRKVVYSIQTEQVGQTLSKGELGNALTLAVDGKTVGWLLMESLPRQQIPNSPEEGFLRTVNSSAFLSALIATALALVLGGLLAFTLTRTLRELTDATVEISKGRLGLQVKVRSKDELGKLAASFNQMSLDLERATSSRRQMTADIAHDLRSPLSVIAGYTEALSDGKLPSSPEIYEILHQETRHLSRLVDDLRTLSLADAGELSLILLPTQPGALLERVAARHAVAVGQNHLSLRVEAASDLPLVSVDAERMAQVFDNLILNAFRYTSPGGEILLSAEAANGQILMRVCDNGSGIMPADLPLIFDRFYRGDKARQGSGESGLGLAIAKSLVEVHHGSITVESAPGAGTTFSIYLPIDKSNSSIRV
jgi:two-component system sensor histidine kinase BaeS